MSQATESKSPPKVLMLGPDLSNKGGIASVLQLYARYWDHQAVKLRMISTFVNGSKLRKFIVAIVALLRYVFFLIFWRPDIVHAHFGDNASFYRKSIFVSLARLLRVKTIMHCHAFALDSFYHRHSSIGKRLIRNVLGSADLLICLSEEWHTYFESIELDVRMAVLYNPVAGPSECTLKNASHPIVLTLGRLGKRKGTFDILQIVPQVLAVCPEAEFWLGGDGEVDEVKKIVTENGWDDHVRLLNWVAGAEKDKVLRDASVFLLPSYHEGLPVSILEAMSYGLPVISTPVGSIRRAVVDGQTGILVQPGDVEGIAEATIHLLCDAQRRASMGAEARQRVSKYFEAGAIMQQLYVLYDRLWIASK